MTGPPPRARFDDEALRKQARRIGRMFHRIAPTYDLLNHLLSAGADLRWRREAVARLHLTGGERVLDACTGTGDLALALLEGGAAEVEGCDLAEGMVRRAREKAGGRARFRVADVTRLPHPEGAFDVATVAFGVRNLADLDRGLGELRRVLRPGGRLLVLEFSLPRQPVVRLLYRVYFQLFLPLIGNLVSGGADNAYAYLPRSVMSFPDPDALAVRLLGAGFRSVTVHPLTLGIATIHLATR